MHPKPLPRAQALHELSAAVKDRRRELSLTQAALGNLAGCGRLFIHHLETGKPTVRLDKLVDVLEILGLRLAVQSGPGGIVDATRARD